MGTITTSRNRRSRRNKIKRFKMKTSKIKDSKLLDNAIDLIIKNKLSLNAASKIFTIPLSLLRTKLIIFNNGK
jgi:hypothetical protein